MGKEGFIISHEGYRNGRYHYKRYNCTWTVTVPQNQSVHIVLSDFGIESKVGLTIYDGPQRSSPVIHNLFGQGWDEEAYSTGSSITVSFITPSAVLGKGFRFYYSSVLKSEFSFF